MICPAYGCKPGFSSLNVKCRVHIVHIFLIQLLSQQLHRLAEALEVDDLPFPQEFDHIVHVRIVRKPQDVVVGHSCLLLWFIT